MDIIYSSETQLEIDVLFAPEPKKEVKVEEEIKEEVEVVEQKPTWYEVEDTFIDELYEAIEEGDEVALEVLDEAAEVVQEEQPLTEDVIVPDKVEYTEPKTFMDRYADALSSVTKRTNLASGNVQINELDLKLEHFQSQLERMKRTILENTIVSGIGQGGDGQTPGSGVVKAADLDDVNMEGVQPGDQLIWDGGQFVPATPGDPGDEVFATKEYVDEQDALRVLKAGDTMNGNLQFKSLTAENYLKISSLRPDGWVSTDSLFGLEINLADGNTYKNQLRVRGRSDKEIVRLWIQDEQRIETNAILNLKPPANISGNTSFLQCRDDNNAISLSVGANGSVRAGTSTAPFIATEDHHLVTKKFSDERLLDVQNQIDNLEASNLTTTQLNYTYESSAISTGEFHADTATFANITTFNFTERDKQNRLFPTDLKAGDVITTREATGTAFVQTFKVLDGSDIANISVQPTATTAGNFTSTDSYIITISRTFEGLATVDYVNTKVAITGDTMTGPLILSGDPGTGLQAATKDYVDTTVSNATPNLDGVILADGSVPMEGTFEARNIDVGNNASIMFSGGNQYLKINNGRKLGIYGYNTDSFTSAWTANIEVSHSLTEFKTVTKAASNFISTRSTGYAIEVKPDDADTIGYWHTNGTMLLKGQVVNTAGCFSVYPKGLSSNNSNVAFSVTNQGQVRLGSAVTIENDFDIVHKRYVDQNFVSSNGGSSSLSDYLPLTGGTLTGGLTQKSNSNFFVQNSSGTEGFRIEPSGFCRTMDLFRSERTDNGPALQARNNTTLNAEIRCDGTATFKTSVKKDNKELATEEYVDNAVQTAGTIIQPAFMDFVWRTSQTQVVNAGYFNRGPSGSNQINVDYQTWSGMVWCAETNFTGDQGIDELFSVYKKNNDGSWELKLVAQVRNVTWGYRTDSFARRRMELKDLSIKMGSYSNLVDYGTYYCKLGGVF